MKNKIKLWFKVLYVKYVLGQCHHICHFCAYRNMCYDEIEYDDLK